MHQVKYVTIANYQPAELRYMKAGNEAQKRRQGQKVTPGYQ
jgi:hypothetical protein